jgi:hypothetical protein
LSQGEFGSDVHCSSPVSSDVYLLWVARPVVLINKDSTNGRAKVNR